MDYFKVYSTHQACKTLLLSLLKISFFVFQVSNVLKDLETSNELSGARAVDIKALHSVLTGNLQGTTMGQKQMIDEEIQR